MWVYVGTAQCHAVDTLREVGGGIKTTTYSTDVELRFRRPEPLPSRLFVSPLITALRAATKNTAGIYEVNEGQRRRRRRSAPACVHTHTAPRIYRRFLAEPQRSRPFRTRRPPTDGAFG